MKAEPIILAIETATSSCSVAINYQQDVIERHEVGNNVHSKVLLEMVQDLLAQTGLKTNDIDAVAVGQGPGSFTGLRIGVGVAQGIAYGIDAPMIGISSLDALANQAAENGRVIAGIDARMGEIYWCEYVRNNDGILRIGELRVTSPEDITCSEGEEGKLQLLGNAWAEYQDRFSAKLMKSATVDDAQTYPMADSLLELAQAYYIQGKLINAIDFAPEYVRNDVAKKSSKSPVGVK